MTSRVAHVFETYWTRPLMLLMFVISLGFACGLYYSALRGGNFQFPIAPTLSRPSPHQATAISMSTPSQVGSNLRSLRIFGIDSQELPDLSALTKLKTLELQIPRLSTKAIEQLQGLPKLESLSLKTSAIPDGLLSALGPRLRELEVPSQVLVEHAHELSHLTALGLLIVDRSDMRGETFSAISQIPHLRTLVLPPEVWNDNSGRPTAAFPDELDLPPDAFQPLTKLPHLRSVFSNWSPTLLKQRGFLSAIHAYPYQGKSKPFTVITIAVCSVVICAFAIFLQLLSQMLVPAAMVVPHYIAPHRQVALRILLVAAIVAIDGQVIGGIHPLAAGCCVLFYPLLIALCSYPVLLSGRFLSWLQLMARTLLGATFFLPQFLWYALPAHLKGTAYWFIEGRYPLEAAILLTVEILLILGVFFCLRKITQQLHERVQNVVAFSPWAPQWHQQFNANVNMKWKFSSLGMRIRNLAFHKNSLWNQISLLRAGNPFQGILIRSLAAMCVIGLGGLVGSSQKFEQLWDTYLEELSGLSHRTLQFLIPTILGQAAVLMLIGAFVMWMQRLKTIETEVCRPVQRRDFVKQLYCCLAIDQSTALIPATLLAIFGIMHPREGGNVAESYGFAALGLAACLFAYACSTFCFAFKRDWVVLANIVLAMVTAATVMYCGSVLLDMDSQEVVEQARPLYLLALALILMAVILFTLSYRRALHREWG